jgi:hypothetical protein
MNQGSGGRGVARLPNGCESEGGLPLEHDDAGYRQGKAQDASKSLARG